MSQQPSAGYIPVVPDVEDWAPRVRKRRQAWLHGPTEEERVAWMMVEGQRRIRQTGMGPGGYAAPPGYGTAGYPDPAYEPTADEVEQWAAAEHDRRQVWAAGPTREERAVYANRSGTAEPRFSAGPRFAGGDFAGRGPNWSYGDAADRLRREMTLASEGAWARLMIGPYRLWADLIDEGKTYEASYGRPMNRRVPLYDC